MFWFGREWTPHLTLRAAVEYGHDLAGWPRQYLPAKPRPRPSQG